MTEPRDQAADIAQQPALERRLAQLEQQNAALRAECRRYEHALGGTGVGAWEWDLATGSVWWSPECFKLLGYAPGEFSPSEQTLAAVIPGGDAQAIIADLQGAPGTEADRCEEYRLRHRDGHEVPVRVELRVRYGPDGRPTRLAGVLRDNREEARERERYARLFDTAADFVFVHPLAHDLDGIRFTEVNAEACRRLGYSLEEMRRLGPNDITEPTELPEARTETAQLDTAGELIFTRTLVGRDGERIPVEIRARRYQEDGRQMVISVARDISARQWVRESLDALINAQPDKSLLIDREGRILAANEVVARRFGFQTGYELQGRDAYSLLDPGAAARRRMHGERALATGVPVSFRDERAGRIIEHVLNPVRDASGAVSALAIHGRDITDLVLQQRELADHERRLRLLLDSLPAMVAHVDHDGRYLQVNAQHEEIFGISREQFVGRTLQEVVGEEVDARLAPYVARVLAGEPQAFTIEVPFLDGTDHWLDVRYVPDHDGQQVVGYYALVLDVTETRRARERLRASEAQLELFFDQVPVAIVMGGADGVISRANPAAEEFFGHGPGQLTGRHISDFSHPDDLASDLEAFARVVRGETRSYSMQKRYRRLDGATVWGELTVMAVTEDHDLFFGIIQDITHQKREEQARRDQELERQRLLTAIEQSDESVVITDVHGRIQYVNAAFERVSGYSAAEVEGRNPRLLQSGEHDADFYARMWRTLSSGESWTGRMVNRRRDGTLFTELATISPVRDHAGNVAHYVSVKRDITHELELEEQRRQAQKMEALGKLAGGIAHDFNNILYALMGNTELALGKVHADAEMTSHLEASLTACRRASDLVRQILAFSRRHERHREVHDAAAVTGDALALLTPTLPATVDLVTEVAPDCPAVAVDATEWHQLIMNLATNAVQALPAAKGRVEIRVEPASLATDAGAVPAVRLGVRDDGCGMPPDVVVRCRDPYFTTKPPGVGTGMGLAIVHGIVGSLDGQLEIASQPEVGTTVQVTLPAAPVANDPDAAAAAPADTGSDAPAPGWTPVSRPATVMVVEDEEAIRHLVATALQRRRFQVRTYGDPHEALAAFCDAPAAFDLVITDQTMPGMTGAELSRELLAIRADLPVIVCSGHSEAFGAEQAHALGIRAYLPKPVPLDDLVAAVGRELAEPAGP